MQQVSSSTTNDLHSAQNGSPSSSQNSSTKTSLSSIASKASKIHLINSVKSVKRVSIKNKNLILVIMCACVLMQNIIVGGANNAILTTIERAFYMTSMESAMFLSFYDIANIIASPIVGYFGDHVYKHRVLGFSMLGLSLASMIMIIPEFLYVDPMHKIDLLTLNETASVVSQKDEKLCAYSNATNNSTASTTSPPPNTVDKLANHLMNNMKFIFYLANIINGVSSIALYTVGVSYIENIFLPEQVHMRQGIYYSVGAIGIGIGMVSSSATLRFFLHLCISIFES
jgi:MFS family permease